MSLEAEFRDVVGRLNGLCATVEREFGEVKAELRFTKDANVMARPMFLAVVALLACIAGVSLLLSGYAVSMANGNRALIVELVRQNNQQERQLQLDGQQLEQRNPTGGGNLPQDGTP